MSNKIYYKVLARLLIPAATVVVEQMDLTKCRPSELPIYSPEEKDEAQKPPRQEPNILEQQIGNVRRQVVSMTKEVDRVREAGLEMYEETWNQGQWLVNYLAEEENTTPKVGAIAVGGLAGFILGLRGGFFRKLIFTSAGAMGMASLCYPKEAAEYSELVVTETKKYVKIAYNFYHGDHTLHLEQKEEVIVPVEDEVEIDPVDIITRAYEDSSNENCHCPIGTCLNPKDEANVSQLSNPFDPEGPDSPE